VGDFNLVEAQHQKYVFRRQAGLPRDKGWITVKVHSGQRDGFLVLRRGDYCRRLSIQDRLDGGGRTIERGATVGGVDRT